jgi:hypothetical protein
LPSLAFSRDNRNAGNAGRSCRSGQQEIAARRHPAAAARQGKLEHRPSFFEKARSAGKWTRERWTETLGKGVALLHLKALFLTCASQLMMN